jgi:hypothetical protein
MQKNYASFFILSLSLIVNITKAQETIYPTGPQQITTAIINGTVHIGNGNVLNDATVVFEKGKIIQVGNNITVPSNATIIDAKGKQVYPGLILSNSYLGLKEVSNGVRGSNDLVEIGENNASIRSLVSYNTDSKIINVLRANGILLAHIAPEGELIDGQSSVVQLDAWNFEDATYKSDIGQFIELPSFVVRQRGRGFARQGANNDPMKEAFTKIETIKKFFREAKAYLQEKNHVNNNLKFEATRGLFDGNQKLFVRANEVKQMLMAIDLGKEFGFKIVIVGASESFQIAPILAANNIPVILDDQHALPNTEDDDIDQPYKLPAQLTRAGVLVSLSDMSENTKQRNLAFNAGTAATYGLSKEEALSAITLNSAKVLGIENVTGSIEVGKDANIVISEGDLLDMRGNQVVKAFIQGRDISLDNKQKQLYERFKQKFKLK